MSDPYDLLLVGGILVNPATGIHQPMDVGVTGGRIAQMAPKSRSERKESFGCAWWLRDSGFDRLPCPQLLGGESLWFQCRLHLPCEWRDNGGELGRASGRACKL